MQSLFKGGLTSKHQSFSYPGTFAVDMCFCTSVKVEVPTKWIQMWLFQIICGSESYRYICDAAHIGLIVTLNPVKEIVVLDYISIDVPLFFYVNSHVILNHIRGRVNAKLTFKSCSHPPETSWALHLITIRGFLRAGPWADLILFTHW